MEVNRETENTKFIVVHPRNLGYIHLSSSKKGKSSLHYVEFRLHTLGYTKHTLTVTIKWLSKPISSSISYWRLRPNKQRDHSITREKNQREWEGNTEQVRALIFHTLSGEPEIGIFEEEHSWNQRQRCIPENSNQRTGFGLTKETLQRTETGISETAFLETVLHMLELHWKITIILIKGSSLIITN